MDMTKQATGVILQSIIDQGNKTIADVNTNVTNGTNSLEVFKDLKIKELRDENPKLISQAKLEISEATKTMVASVNKEGALQIEAIKAVGVDAVIETGKQEVAKVIAEGDKQVNRVSQVLDTKQDKVDNKLTTKSKNVVEAINEVNSSALSQSPIGAIIPFPSQNIPLGWLLCNGNQVNETDYPELAKILGATAGKITLPDLRGQFLRGLDNGKGIDTGRTMLSEQGDTIRNIVGLTQVVRTFSNEGVNETGPFSADSIAGPDTGYAYSTLSTGQYAKRIRFDASRAVPTSSENRPKNIALNYIIKAKNIANEVPSIPAIDEIKNILKTKLDKGTYVGLASDLWSNENCQSNFAHNTGWQKLKSGLIIQFGYFVRNDSTGKTKVNFPVSFSSYYSVSFCDIAGFASNNNNTVSYNEYNTTYMNVRHSVGDIGVMWIATGY